MAVWHQAWNEYRGWAKRSRELNASTQRWNIAALSCTVAAALLGAAAALPNLSAEQGVGKGLALAATIVAGAGAYLGRQLLATEDETNARLARATGEGIKSECFRFAAKAGAYAAEDPGQTFLDKVALISKPAEGKGILRADGDVAEGDDKREPIADMSKDWYVKGRIEDQKNYFKTAIAKQSARLQRLWWVSFLSGLAAVIFGGLGTLVSTGLAPWVGAMTTVVAAVTAAGLIDRRKYLVASYEASRSSLSRIQQLDAIKPMSLPDLATAVEDLLEGEHKAWYSQMTTGGAGATAGGASANGAGQ